MIGSALRAVLATVNKTGESTGWSADIANFEYKAELSLSLPGTSAGPHCFSADGVNLYVIDSTQDLLRRFSLSEAFNPSTGSSVNNVDVSGIDTSHQGLAISNDGGKLFFLGAGSDRVRQYSLSTPFDTSSMTYETFKSTLDSVPQDVSFSRDGLHYYISTNGDDTIEQWDLTDAFDLDTASFASELSVAAVNLIPSGVHISDDGRYLYISNDNLKVLDEYYLSEPYVLSTAEKTSATLSLSSTSAIRSISFSPNGERLFVIDSGAEAVDVYSLIEL